MATLTFDTLQVARRLRDGGMVERVADALTDPIRESVTSSDLATKSDIALVRSDLSTMAAEFNAGLSNTKAELLKRVFGALIAQGALVPAVLKVLPGQ